MREIRFSSRVLGSRASMRLQRHVVWQTIRSANSDLVKGGARPGDRVEIFLDAERLGLANLEVLEPVNGSGLRLQDAVWGGFDSTHALIRALQNANFRFKPLDQYHLCRIIFSFLGPWPPIEMPEQVKKERTPQHILY